MGMGRCITFMRGGDYIITGLLDGVLSPWWGEGEGAPSLFVALNLAPCSGYRLYPGQIVILPGSMVTFTEQPMGKSASPSQPSFRCR